MSTALSLRGIEKFSSCFLVPRGTGRPLFIVQRPWHEITSPEANAHDDHLLAFRPTFLSFVRYTAVLSLSPETSTFYTVHFIAFAVVGEGNNGS